MDTTLSPSRSNSRQGLHASPRTSKGNRFPETRWTLVAKAGGESVEARRRALGELCAMYWYPVYAFLRFRGKSPADAEDLTQGFFERILRKEGRDWVHGVRGRLRSYLLGALKHHLADQRAWHEAQKRGGKVSHVSIERELAEHRYQSEPRNNCDPESLYERAWALSLLDRAFKALEAEFLESRQKALFQDLRSQVASPEDRVDYPAVAGRHGMKEGAVRVALHRMRKRFAALVREEIAETVSGEEEAKEELAHLYAVFAN